MTAAKHTPTPGTDIRKIIGSITRSDVILCALECGHVAELAPHFSVSDGDRVRCGRCNSHDALVAALDECKIAGGQELELRARAENRCNKLVAALERAIKWRSSAAAYVYPDHKMLAELAADFNAAEAALKAAQVPHE